MKNYAIKLMSDREQEAFILGWFTQIVQSMELPKDNEFEILEVVKDGDNFKLSAKYICAKLYVNKDEEKDVYFNINETININNLEDESVRIYNYLDGLEYSVKYTSKEEYYADEDNYFDNKLRAENKL